MAVVPASRRASAAGHSWPLSDVLREHAPVVRLLSAIWTIPQVTRIGLTLGTRSVDLWVFMSEDNSELEAQISAAERAYIATVGAHGFTLHVIPDGAVPPDALPPYETLIER